MSWWNRTAVRDAPLGEPLPTELGLLYSNRNASDAASASRLAYLSQLIDEQYASADGSAILVSWKHLHRLMVDEAHVSSQKLLDLPPVTKLVPQLESSGTPSDSNFKIAITHWISPTKGVAETNVQRLGALLIVQGQRQLIPETIYSLIQEIQALATHGVSWDSEGRLLSAGRISKLATSCGARLDHYLAHTNIVVADRLHLELSRSDVLGVPLVEVRPTPEGAPKEWLNTFDRYESARRKYDVVQEDGMAHVVSTPEVAEVLQAIKKIPNRRLASDEARLFVHNPYAVLGDAAEHVIHAEQFEASRHAAGLAGKVLRVAGQGSPSSHEINAVVIDVSGASDDLWISLSRADALHIIEAHQRSVSRGLPMFAWQGHEIEISGETATSMTSLQQWIAEGDLSRFTINRAEVLDLSAYSDRVVGFDGAMISVPYVARKDATKGWIPENIERGVVRQETSRGPSDHIPFTQDQIKTLEVEVERAIEKDQKEVKIPGTDKSIPIKEAAAWVKAFESETITIRKKSNEPRLSKDPEGGGPTPVLRILHNIEKLDYGASGSMIPVLPEGLQPQLPAALRSSISLLPHQHFGLAWMQHRFEQRSGNVNGCLLADDMGLGKTLQALCLISWYLESNPDAHSCLIVAPVSLLENWKSEIKKFLDGRHDPVLSLYGDDLKHHRLHAVEIDSELQALGLRKFLRPGFERGHRIVLTTYETLRDFEFSLARVTWGIVVCDEAQKIKTPGALVTRASKALRGEFKIACTGTPVENTLADLWCLFDFFQPGLLGSLNEFTKVFRRAIETRIDGYDELVEKLRSSVGPWILRRMKFEVTKLPKRIDHHHQDADFEWRLPMSGLQQRLYKAAVEQYRRLAETEMQGTAILRVLHTLRMICSNPVACAHENAEFLSIEHHLKESPKLAWLIDRLAEIRTRDEKAIVFTEYRELQRLIQRAILARFDFRPQIVNGDTSVDPRLEASRQALIDRFQATSGFGVIILSTTAVGFGVNVQGANHVIHFTRPWNPAKEDQATDRAYRIGQTRDVFVYCPTIIGSNFESFDQRVDALLKEKRSLSRDILAGTQEITLQEFRGL
jgi:hypothetical protein